MLTKPKKSLGQNFLIDKNILQKIVNTVSIHKNNEILEIGPGTGNLTDYLIKKNPKKIFVVEKDSNLSLLLYEKFKNKINITLGLPFIRISPDHGTNNQMLGQNKSDPTSFKEAINFADKIRVN